MERIEVFRQWNEIVFNTQEENGLIDLYHVDGSSSGSIMSDVLFKKKAIHPIPYSVFKLHDEFIVISKDMKYVTGILLFLKPYIVNTEEVDGRYNQNLADRRYLFYCTAALGAVYNFWDRIGDLLHHYFPTNIKPGRVYFGQVKDAIPAIYQTKDSYKKLVELYEETKELFDLRHEAVHHFQVETKHYWGNIQHINDEAKRNRLNAEKFTYPDKMKKAMEICNDAFFEAIKSIDELPDDPEIIKLRSDATAPREENT